MLRTVSLIILALAMLAVIIATWGSMGSLILTFALGAGACGVLVQHFITNRDEDIFQDE